MYAIRSYYAMFTLVVVPVCYWLIYANRPGHGLPVTVEEELPGA